VRPGSGKSLFGHWPDSVDRSASIINSHDLAHVGFFSLVLSFIHLQQVFRIYIILFINTCKKESHLTYCPVIMARGSIAYAYDMAKGLADGLQQSSDMFNRIQNDDKDRSQRYAIAEAERLGFVASNRSNLSSDYRHYKAWDDKVGPIINSLCDRAQSYQSIPHVNLDKFDRLRDATICRVCLDLGHTRRYYMSSMCLSSKALFFRVCLQMIDDHRKQEDDSGWITICGNCIGDRRRFKRHNYHRVDIGRSLPQPEPDLIRCSDKHRRRATDDVFLRKLYCTSRHHWSELTETTQIARPALGL
jgi:hypothetical protein